MLTVFSTVFGFLAPFFPQLLKLFQNKQDNKHELDMMRLRLQAGAQEHLWKMEEINAQADIREAETLRQPQQSFGVQLIDAAQHSKLGNWALVPAFYLFVLLDWFSGMVRPTVTYGIVAFYMTAKYAQYDSFMAGTVNVAWTVAIQQIWSENDLAVLMLVLSYWFGQRAAKAAFGGSAAHGKPGGG